MKISTLIFAAVLALSVGPALSLAAFADGPSVSAKADTPSVAAKAGDYIGDSALTAKVKAALLSEKNLKSLPISVQTTDGVVTLTGDVISSAQSEQAEDVTKHVKGVKNVHNALKLTSGK